MPSQSPGRQPGRILRRDGRAPRMCVLRVSGVRAKRRGLRCRHILIWQLSRSCSSLACSPYCAASRAKCWRSCPGWRRPLRPIISTRLALPYIKPYISKEEIALAASVASVFFVALVVVSLFTVKLSDVILDSKIGALDRYAGLRLRRGARAAAGRGGLRLLQLAGAGHQPAGVGEERPRKADSRRLAATSCAKCCRTTSTASSRRSRRRSRGITRPRRRLRPRPSRKRLSMPADKGDAGEKQ